MPYYGGDPIQTDAGVLMQRLMARGMSRMQAAAVVGNLKRESGLISNNVNPNEGAYGLMQWRGDRFMALQQFAKQQGKPWTDPLVQADFIGHELASSEQRNAAGFYGATDIDNATKAFGQGVVRFGDQSLGERQMYARDLYGSSAGQQIKPGAIAERATGQKPGENQRGVSRETLPGDDLLPNYSRPRGIRGGIEAFGRGLARGIMARPAGLGSVFAGAGPAPNPPSAAAAGGSPAQPQSPAFLGDSGSPPLPTPRPETAPAPVAPGLDAVRAPGFNVARMGALADQAIYEDGDWYA